MLPRKHNKKDSKIIINIANVFPKMEKYITGELERSFQEQCCFLLPGISDVGQILNYSVKVWNCLNGRLYSKITVVLESL